MVLHFISQHPTKIESLPEFLRSNSENNAGPGPKRSKLRGTIRSLLFAQYYYLTNGRTFPPFYLFLIKSELLRGRGTVIFA